MSSLNSPLNPENDLTYRLKKRSNWDVFMGVLEVLLGLVLIVFPFIAGTVTTIIIGAVLLVAGVVEIVLALGSHTAGRFFLRLLLGVIYGIGGFLLLANPVWGVAVLTIVLGVILIVEGITTAVLAFQIRPDRSWGWLLFDSAITLLLGILILYGWPSTALWALGTLVGVAILVRGITRIAVSLGLRRAATSVLRFPGQKAA